MRDLFRNLNPELFTKLQAPLLIAGLGLLLSACGGGGGGSSSSEGGNAEQETVNQDDPVSREPVVSTSEIVVPNGFTFSDSDSLVVSLSVGEDAYLSICGRKDDTSSLNYGDCRLRTWVRGEAFTAEIDLPQPVDHLFAAVLMPDHSTTPNIYEWRREEGMNWIMN